ncbi:MAG: HEAT repeat domain-containing protein [Planctomycetota bacterium]
MRRNNTFTAAFRNLCTGLLIAGVVLPAHAQVAPRLPASVVESASTGSAELDAIDSYLAALREDALDGDGADAAAARAALVEPLRENRPSVSFRQAYARAAADLIEELLETDDPAARLAGLRMAGNLGTGESARIITEALRDPNDGFRVFAAVQARRVFEVSSQHGPALTDSQSSGLADAVADTLAETRDRVATEAYIRALGTAAQSRPREMAGCRALAATRLGQAMSGRVRSVNAEQLLDMRDPIIIAASSLTRTLSDPSTDVPGDAVRNGAAFGGDVLARLLTRELDGTNDATIGEDVRLLRAAESLVYFARQRQAGNGASIPQTNLAGLLETGSRDFRRELVALIGPGSAMLGEFGFADDRFIK